jgi:aminomethyltransferase
MVDFGGWDMPLQYAGIIEEHRAVRENVGVFDVSHMGEIEVRGPRALDFVQYLVTNNVGRLSIDQVLYTPMCNENGGTVDDLLVYRLPDLERDAEKFLLVVNAGTTPKDYAWIEKQAAGFEGVEVINVSSSYAQLAIQGPAAEEVLQHLVDVDLSRINYFWAVEAEHYKEAIVLSRTGYTGEDGFEIYGLPQTITQLWKDLIKAEVAPIGLGARDSLRFDACYALYDHELDDVTTPIEAGLNWTVKKKPEHDYLGKEVLMQQKAEGGSKTLVGFEMTQPGVARQGYPIYLDGAEAGVVSSGMKSTTVDKFLGLGFINRGFDHEIGSQIEIEIRNTRKTAEIIETPFFRGSVKMP